jgi:CRP/FNR family transcriptional regulator
MAARPDRRLRDSYTEATPTACLTCPIRRRAFCRALADRQLSGYFALATERTFEPGETIADTGAPAEFVDIVRTGSAFVYRELPDLRRAIMQVLLPTDAFGLTSFGQHSLTVQATGKTLVCRFRKSDVENLMVEFPEIQRAIHHYLNTLTHILEERVVTLGLKNSLQRVVSFVTYVWGYQEWPADDNASFELPLSRPEIADLTGLSPETVSKCFTALRKMRIIDLPRPQEVTILDKEKFLAIGYEPANLPPDLQQMLQNFQKAM